MLFLNHSAKYRITLLKLIELCHEERLRQRSVGTSASRRVAPSVTRDDPACRSGRATSLVRTAAHRSRLQLPEFGVQTAARVRDTSLLVGG